MAAALAIVSVVAVRHLRERPAAPPPAIRLGFPAPPGAELGFGDEPLDAAISPDGTQVVFVATSNGVTQLWQRRLDEERAAPIAGTEGAQLPAWKQTGAVISFFAFGRLKAIGVDTSSSETHHAATDLAS